MGKKHREVYEILTNIDKLTEYIYEQLVSFYGCDVVDSIIEQMSSDNEDNFFKFEIYFSNVVKSLESTVDLNIFNLYCTDIKCYPPLDSDGNTKLMEEISVVIEKLNDVFLKIGCDDSVFKGNATPWIADKVKYCLVKCNDSEWLSMLNKLYNEYEQIRKLVIVGNLRLVVLIAKEYFCHGIISFEDIVQYGNIGLMRAIEKYDSNKGSNFATYACKWIKQCISKNIRNIKYPTWIPSYVITKYHKIINSRNQLSILMGREPSNRELAEYMSESVEKIEEITMAFLDSISLDNPLDFMADDLQLSFHDLMADNSVDVCETVSNHQLMNLLEQHLNKRQLFVIVLSFGLKGSQYDVTEIAHMLGCSHQRIGQIRKEAIKKLQKIPGIRDFAYH